MNIRYLVLAGMLVSSGCFTTPTQGPTPEQLEREKDLDVETVGAVTEVANVAPLKLAGVGLVTGLNGTGDAPKGNYRTMLEQELRKRKIENVKAILDSPNHALVVVHASMPAGGYKGEPLDVEVTLPEGSRATSLRGGFLQECSLRNWESTHNLAPDTQAGNKLLSGHILAKASGALIVGLGNPDEAVEQKRARIWEGAVSLTDRPFHFILKNDRKSARVANAVADRINFQFQDDPRRRESVLQNQRLLILGSVEQELNKFEPAGVSRGEMAKAMNKEMLAVRVPFAYRFAPDRYLRVARLVPLREAPEQQSKYRQRLQQMLLDPAETVRAALRLEALGKDAVNLLKTGLTSEHPLVRYTAAESLAYLGSTAGVTELAKLAIAHEPLRFGSLLALANLDESICRQKLGELMTHPHSELRAGAFRALRILDHRDERLGAEFLSDTFWLNITAPGSEGMINVSMAKRAEVVCFGDDVQLLAPFRLNVAPEFILTAEAGDDRCTVARIQVGGGVSRKQCSLRVPDIVRAMAELGASYPDVVEMLRRADERGPEGQRCLSCLLRINAMPTEYSYEALSEGGRDPQFLHKE